MTGRDRTKRMLSRAERMVLRRNWRAHTPQLFVLGLPRSGTTLIYQWIVHRLDVAYFTNGVGVWPCSPGLVTLAQRLRHGDYRSDFRSEYGKVEGPVAPREAGMVFGGVFGFEDYVAADEVDQAKADRLRRTIALVQRGFGDRPFVNKNVKHVLRVEALARIFPDARFLVIERDVQDVALSIVRARMESGDPERWWSVRPPEYETLCGLPVAQQVAWQVRSVRRQLDEDVGRLAVGRLIRIDYERFCSEPEQLAALLRDRLGVIGDRNPPVGPFSIARSKPRDDRERDTLATLASLQ